MVRMRDVLKSMRDMKRPGQEESSDSDEQREKGGLRFPEPSSRSKTPQQMPFPSPSSEKPGEGSGETPPASEELPPPPSAPHEARTASGAPAEETFTSKEAEEARAESPYHKAIRTIDDFLQEAKGEEPFDLEPVEKVSAKFVDMLLESDQLFLQALSARMTMTSMAQHSANVAIVAIKIAGGLGLPKEQMIEVGMAGMVHEVGMVRVPDDIINKRGELSPSEYEKIKQHPLFGRQILEAVRDEYPFLPDVIVQEHERWNGNGYPFGLKENDIHEYAQIIGLADTFVALTHMRHYRDNFIAYKAIQSIIERRNIDFSARMIKALIDVISIFPVYSLVKLNNGSIARVVQTNKKYPVRPVIRLVANSKGQKIEKEEIVDLSNEPMIYIVSPVLDEAAYM